MNILLCAYERPSRYLCSFEEVANDLHASPHVLLAKDLSDDPAAGHIETHHTAIDVRSLGLQQ